MKKCICIFLIHVFLLLTLGTVVSATDQGVDYATENQIPYHAAGYTVHTVVIMKPFTSGPAAGYSATRFLFTADFSAGTYGAHWGIGFYGENGVLSYVDGVNHLLNESCNYGTGDTYFWNTDPDGSMYFQNVMVPPPNGTDGKWVDSMGNSYDSLYDMAKAGQLIAFIGEHDDRGIGGGNADGRITSDEVAVLDANALSPHGNGLDAVMLRVMTEEAYYGEKTNKDGERYPSYPKLAQALVEHPDMIADLKTLSGKKTSHISFLFDSEWASNGYNCRWGVGLRSVDENGKAIFEWFDCNNDEDVMLNGERIATTWSHEYFQWTKHDMGEQIFRVIFQIPEDKLAAAGYESMHAAAKAGALYCMIADTQTEVNGLIDCDPRGTFMANTVIDGKDACLIRATAEPYIYGTFPPPVDDPSDPTPTDTLGESESEPQSTPESAPDSESKPAATDNNGCGAAIGMTEMLLLAAVPLVFLRKKSEF